jgi:hypothetical protein
MSKSKNNRQHNGQNEKYKRTNNDLQTIHIKLKLNMNACILSIHLSNLEYLLIINDYYTNNLPTSLTKYHSFYLLVFIIYMPFLKSAHL